MPASAIKHASVWRFGFLLAAVRLAWKLDALFRRFPQQFHRLADWRPGVTVVIPERGTPQLLERCLECAISALQRLGEEFEIVVVINGVPRGLYAQLEQAIPHVRWLYSRRALGFSGAIELGVRQARFDGVYLLNSDMFLAPDALTALAPWRAAHVFAVASQIFFLDQTRRREETGWTGFRATGGLVEIFDVPPEDAGTVRGHLYAGGGSSLFRRQLLLRFLSRSHPYNPVYFEDVEWGVRAWQAGYEVLFCPASHATHVHRATVSQLLSNAEVERIVWRNQLLFTLRNGFARGAASILSAGPPGGWDAGTFRELTRLRQALSLLKSLWIRTRSPARFVDLERVHLKFYLRPLQPLTKPVVLVVSPFVVYPPSHGGARRMANLWHHLAAEFDIVVLSDEETLYDTLQLAQVNGPAAIHLTGARPAESPGLPLRIARTRSHSHLRLQRETERLSRVYGCSSVQIEYGELAALIEKRRDAIPWIITLHDVLCSAGGRSAEDRYEAGLIAKYTAAIACSAEDASLVHNSDVVVVPNSASRPAGYVSSRGNRSILFAGPFRYEPNLSGILSFLETVYPSLCGAIRNLELVILGGKDAASVAREHAAFDQPGVRVLDHVDDVAPWYAASALTINPVLGIRGSSIKLLESIAFGRVCLSTLEGSRGFRHLSSPALVVVPHIPDFLPVLRDLLLDEELRLLIEKPTPEVEAGIGWDKAARIQADLYWKLQPPRTLENPVHSFRKYP